jgi:hypothetical protein
VHRPRDKTQFHKRSVCEKGDAPHRPYNGHVAWWMDFHVTALR